ncbi:hypothetical protein [Rufibacter roseus]|uniref:Stress-induced acidophilic repeat motif-containing protein n=1 Tax=Rufibacter roseus TaxID=1567108 RepID=A0ABW2DMF3_9BACT|nr:hypothetical protein [Rufibacter roseus]
MENQNKNQEQYGFSSNPEKSFEAGKKGGTPATEVTNQASGGTGGSRNNDKSSGLGDTFSRAEPNKPEHGHSELDRPISDKERGGRNA